MVEKKHLQPQDKTKDHQEKTNGIVVLDRN